MQRRAFLGLGVALCLLLVSCSQQAGHKSPESRPEVAAASSIASAFAVSGSPESPIISISKSALDKEFLLQTGMIVQPVAAMGHSQKSRIVAFQRKGNRLYMLEASKGHTVSQHLLPKFILAGFDITSENSNWIHFDFNGGMSRIFVGSEWWAHDFEGTDYAQKFIGTKVDVSYLDHAAINDNNQLSITQIAQVRATVRGVDENPTLQVRYYLSPYRPDPEYQKSDEPDLQKAGFFENAPQLTDTGDSVLYATKLQHKKPIVFAVSSNTPEEYRDAVRDGILYWNGAFEKPTVQAIVAPEGVVAPDINYNVIQWVNWDQAGMAYADAQLDPRTGQILHAQAYITSTFAFGARREGWKMLRRLKQASTSKGPKSMYGLQGFMQPALCHLDLTERMAKMLNQVLLSGADDKAVLRVSQDMVRLVVAHEVGHLMGLRHNFAGSTTTENYLLSERHRILEKYIATGEVPKDLRASSSVMDYMPVEDEILQGRLIAMGTKPFSYDQRAIDILYFNQPVTDEVPVFCTDSERGKYQDCQAFDSGASVAEGASESSNALIRELPYLLMESVIDAKIRNPKLKIQNVNIDARNVASAILADRSAIYRRFDEPRYLRTLRKFSPLTDLTIDVAADSELDFFVGEIDRLGGLAKMMPPLSLSYVTGVEEVFMALLDDERFTSGAAFGGLPFSFTEDEVKYLRWVANRFFSRFGAEAIRNDVDLVNRLPESWQTEGTALGTRSLAFLSARAEMALFGLQGKVVEAKIKLEDGKTVEARLPTFDYPDFARTAATRWVEGTTGSRGWGRNQKTDLSTRFVKLVNTAVGTDLMKINAGAIDVTPAAAKPAVVAWIKENQDLVKRLTP